MRPSSDTLVALGQSYKVVAIIGIGNKPEYIYAKSLVIIPSAGVRLFDELVSGQGIR